MASNSTLTVTAEGKDISVQTTLDGLRKTVENFDKGVSGKLMNVFSAVRIGTMIVSQLQQTFSSMIDEAKQLENLSIRFRTNTEEIQKFKRVATETNVPIGVLARSFKILEKNLDTAGKDAASPLAIDLKKLGFSFEDLKRMQKNGAEAFWELKDALMSISDESIRGAYGAEIFGFAWNQLQPVMEKTNAELKELEKGTNILSEAQILAARKVGEQQRAIGEDVKGLISPLMAWWGIFLNALDTIWNAIRFVGHAFNMSIGTWLQQLPYLCEWAFGGFISWISKILSKLGILKDTMNSWASWGKGVKESAGNKMGELQETSDKQAYAARDDRLEKLAKNVAMNNLYWAAAEGKDYKKQLLGWIDDAHKQRRQMEQDATRDLLNVEETRNSNLLKATTDFERNKANKEADSEKDRIKAFRESERERISEYIRQNREELRLIGEGTEEAKTGKEDPAKTHKDAVSEIKRKDAEADEMFTSALAEQTNLLEKQKLLKEQYAKISKELLNYEEIKGEAMDKAEEARMKKRLEKIRTEEARNNAKIEELKHRDAEAFTKGEFTNKEKLEKALEERKYALMAESHASNAQIEKEKFSDDMKRVKDAAVELEKVKSAAKLGEESKVEAAQGKYEDTVRAALSQYTKLTTMHPHTVTSDAARKGMGGGVYTDATVLDLNKQMVSYLEKILTELEKRHDVPTDLSARTAMTGVTTPHN